MERSVNEAAVIGGRDFRKEGDEEGEDGGENGGEVGGEDGRSREKNFDEETEQNLGEDFQFMSRFRRSIGEKSERNEDKEKPRMAVRPHQDRTTQITSFVLPLPETTGSSKKRRRPMDQPGIRNKTQPQWMTSADETRRAAAATQTAVSSASSSNDNRSKTALVIGNSAQVKHVTLWYDVTTPHQQQQQSLCTESPLKRTERPKDQPPSPHLPLSAADEGHVAIATIRPSLLSEGRHLSGVKESDVIRASRRRHSDADSSTANHSTDESLRQRSKGSNGVMGLLRAGVVTMTSLLVATLVLLWCHCCLGLDLPMASGLGAVLCLSLALALTVSLDCRCVAVLVWPSLSTSRGRLTLIVFTLSLVLRGPLEDICANVEETARVIECAAHVTFNQTTLEQPLDAQLLLKLNVTMAELQRSAEAVGRGIRSLHLSHIQTGVNGGTQQMHETEQVTAPQCIGYIE